MSPRVSFAGISLGNLPWQGALPLTIQPAAFGGQAQNLQQLAQNPPGLGAGYAASGTVLPGSQPATPSDPADVFGANSTTPVSEEAEVLPARNLFLPKDQMLATEPAAYSGDPLGIQLISNVSAPMVSRGPATGNPRSGSASLRLQGLTVEEFRALPPAEQQAILRREGDEIVALERQGDSRANDRIAHYGRFVAAATAPERRAEAQRLQAELDNLREPTVPPPVGNSQQRAEDNSLGPVPPAPTPPTANQGRTRSINYLELGRGLLVGLGVGAVEGLWGMISAMPKLAWALITDFDKTVEGFYTGIRDLIKAIREGDLLEIAEHVAPELAQLARNWDQLSDYERGRLIGQFVGREGAPILAGVGAAKLLERLRAARRAPNRMPRGDRFPTRDAEGVLHTHGSRLPDRVPRDLRAGEIRDAIEEARGSLARRRARQAERQPGAEDILRGKDRDLTPTERRQRGHDQRIVEEERWLRQLEERLGELER